MSNGDWAPENEPGLGAPPIEVDDMLPPTPTKWPTVVGIICIVFASIGVLCYACNSVMTIFPAMMMSSIPEDQRPPTPQGAQLIIQVGGVCISWVLSLWMLIAGIGLVRRRAWARKQLLGWAFAKIAVNVISTVLTILILDQIVKQTNDSMSAQGPPPFTFTKGMFLAIILTFFVWYLVWPVFLILWLGKDSVKAEVDEWAAESAAAI